MESQGCFSGQRPFSNASPLYLCLIELFNCYMGALGIFGTSSTAFQLMPQEIGQNSETKTKNENDEHYH